MRTMAWTVALALIGALCAQAQMSLGSISGVVVDDSGKALKDMRVTWYRSVVRPTDRQASQGSTYSDKSGQFQFTGLGPATYVLCVNSDVQRSLAANCAWTRKPVSVTLPYGTEQITNYRLTVLRGTRVEIHVEDKKKLVNASGKAGAGTALRLGLVRKGDPMLVPARIEGRTGESQDYVVVVPPQIDVALVVDGRDLKFKDEKDADLPAGAVARVAGADAEGYFKFVPGEAPKTVKIKVDKESGK